MPRRTPLVLPGIPHHITQRGNYSLKGEDAGLLDLVPWRARHTPQTWKLCLDNGLHDAALIERIRDATQRGQPLGDEAFVKWAREQSQARKAPPAEPPKLG